jgi:hypothetical protein
LATSLADQAHLDASELPRYRDDVEPVHARDDRVRSGRPAGEHVDEVHTKRADLEPELARERELRIRVDDKHPPSLACESTARFAAVVVFPTPPFC